MAKKKTKNPSSSETPSLADAPVLTAQQRAQQAKEEKEAKKAEKQQLRQELYAEAKTRMGGGSRGMTVALTVLIGVIVLGCALLLTLQVGGGWRAKENVTYFLDNAALPEIGDSGMSACVNEVYYTANGGMCVRITFGNGEPTTQHPVKVKITLRNGADELIAEGTTTSVPEKYFVVAGGQKEYTLRLKKDCVKIADDPLSEISYEISIDSEWYESTEGD